MIARRRRPLSSTASSISFCNELNIAFGQHDVKVLQCERTSLQTASKIDRHNPGVIPFNSAEIGAVGPSVW